MHFRGIHRCFAGVSSITPRRSVQYRVPFIRDDLIKYYPFMPSPVSIESFVLNRILYNKNRAPYYGIYMVYMVYTVYMVYMVYIVPYIMYGNERVVFIALFAFAAIDFV